MARKTALVIDDDPVVLDSLESLLDLADYDVVVASTREAALSSLSRKRLDVVLLDVMLPGVTDLGLLRECLAARPIPIVMMTGYGTIALAVEAMKEGAMDFLTKPFEPESLGTVLSQACERFRLADESRRVKPDVPPLRVLDTLVGKSVSLQALRRQIEVVAPVDVSVLIEGETGTGKELVARAIHRLSARPDGPFIAINCAALPRDLVEDMLFGHDRGAFTGADTDRMGKFEEAEGGSLFLDEIGLLPVELQGKLLRVLQERTVERLGSRKQVPVNTRIIAAANVSLKSAAKSGAFREDLYFRLAAFPLVVPPLREREGDIEELSLHFLKSFAQQFGRRVTSFSRRALGQLYAHNWPGNVRELRNVVERAVLLSQGARIEALDLPAVEDGTVPASSLPLRSYDEDMRIREREYLIALLGRSAGKLEVAAAMAGLSYSTLRRKLIDHGLRKEDFRGE